MHAPAIKIVKPVREQVSKEEWETRVNLATCYRLVDYYGMSSSIANHISARVPGAQDQFLINPYGMFYDEITASSLIKINLNGDILLNATDYGVNKAGFVIHGAIHAARHEIDCVAHTHTIAGMAVSCMEDGLLPLAQTSMRFMDIAYHDYAGVTSAIEDRDNLVRDLGNRDVMIMRNHGLLACGSTIGICFRTLLYLEHACQLQVATLSCNTKVRMPPQDVLEQSFAELKTDKRKQRGDLAWPGYLRKMERLDPSFRD
jgi:ribulose-5-phosphate 4-epimerase/fuculose-1-phosphate aldolase